MYFSNIADSEMDLFHEKIQTNFIITLPNALNSRLFKVEQIIPNTLYKIYPLFYCKEIISSNPDDEILDSKCIVCTKQNNTLLKFKAEKPKEKEVYFGLSRTITYYGFALYVYNRLDKTPLVNAKLTFKFKGQYIVIYSDEHGIFYYGMRDSTTSDFGFETIEYNGVVYDISGRHY